MPINLFQGADPSLVTAATRAGMASAPQDWSRTFESVSAEYGRTMKASSDMWRQIGTAAMGSYNAQKAKRQQEELGLGGQPNVDYYRDQAKGFRKEKWDTRKLEGGWFGEEARNTRMEIDQKKQKLYNTLEAEAASYDVQKTLMETADPDATGPYTLEQTAAIQAYMNGEKATPRGNYVLPEEVDGQLKFKMYHDPKLITAKDLIPLGIVNPEEIGKITSFGKEDVVIETDIDKPQQKGGTPIIGNDGEEITFNISDINKSIIPSDDSLPKKQQIRTAIDNIFTNASTIGVNSGDTWDEYQINQTRAGLKPLKENRAAWYADNWAGEGGKSFHKELTSVSVASANLFSQLQKIVPEGQKIEDLTVLGGVKDVDGNPGITVGDFQNSKNYNALTSALFNPGDKYYDKTVTGNLFEEHMMSKIREVRTHGWENSQKNPANITNGNGGKKFDLGSAKGSDIFVDGSGDWISDVEKRMFKSLKSNLIGRKNFGKGKNAFTWDKGKQSYFHAEHGVIINKTSLFETFFKKDLKSNFRQDPWFVNIKDWDGTEYLGKEEEGKKDEPWYKFW